MVHKAVLLSKTASYRIKTATFLVYYLTKTECPIMKFGTRPVINGRFGLFGRCCHPDAVFDCFGVFEKAFNPYCAITVILHIKQLYTFTFRFSQIK